MRIPTVTLCQRSTILLSSSSAALEKMEKSGPVSAVSDSRRPHGGGKATAEIDKSLTTTSTENHRQGWQNNPLLFQTPGLYATVRTITIKEL